MSTEATDNPPGFSARFNRVLDEAGFIKGRGRLTAVALFAGVRLPTARNWIEADMSPRNLNEIVTSLYTARRIPASINKAQLVAYLKDGLINPFEDDEEGAPTDSFLFRTCRAYLTIYRMALAQGFDIYDLDDETLEDLYNTVFKELVVRKLEEPNPQLLLNILLKYKPAFG